MSKREEWIEDADLYAQRGQRFTLEIFPARIEQTSPNCQRITTDDTKVTINGFEFDIEQAESSTEYIRIMNSYGRPTVRWYSHDEFKREVGYDPVDPPCPRDVDQDDWRELWQQKIAGEGDGPRMTLTTDRAEALRRIARLWNGKVVDGVHLLREKCPNIREFVGDLDYQEIERLYYNTAFDRTLISAFGSFDWFNYRSTFLDDTHILRKRVWYNPTLRTKRLINGREDLPDLRGDPRARLPHRFTIGLVATRDALAGQDVHPYHELGDYVIDLASQGRSGQWFMTEVLTGHNGWDLIRSTHRKLRDLHSRGARVEVVFDNRTTAYRIMNHWHRRGLAELPYGPYTSEPNIETGRDHTHSAFADPDLDWIIADWTTTSVLWRHINSTYDPNEVSETFTSIDW